MKIKKEGRIIDIGNVKKVNFVGEAIGLMFSRRQKADSLLFEFKKPTEIKIHSYFVFFSFIAIWLDKESNIIELRKIKPFEISNGIKKPYFKLIEIPINEKNKERIKLLVGD